ncbi:hypothetical protein C7C45_17845 [Micromonospora arborensis]|uniref:Uncharacterized protein n=1 Tax=Micromonospora arborensis TaxID=2116518 RepID=A0A318NSR3_9ACTN|nr:hypothetical protein [Micromonospora arborensis]PYC68840.1 hypothetical protein C7C45_17845 [Micromonospora arborensis]
MPDKSKTTEMIGTMKAGDLVRLTRAASPQFVRPINVRIIRELTDRHTYHGWTWIEAYEVGPDGCARAKRELFVLREGVDLLPSGPSEPTRPATRQQVRRLPVRAR